MRIRTQQFPVIVATLVLSHLMSCAERPKLSGSYRSPSDQEGAGDFQADDSNGATDEANADADTAAPGNAAPAPTTDKPSVSPAVGTGLASGTTVISFTPVRYTAAQYPAFVYAVWVTDANNKYIKTIGARAATRMRYLDKWLAAAGVAAPTQPDGVTGATITYPATPAPIAVTWDMKDKAGAFVPQGNYIINVQMTSSNNTGLSLTIPVEVGASGFMKTDTTMTTGITTFSAKHTP